LLIEGTVAYCNVKIVSLL